MGVSEFLQAIPAAASSPYALIAYVVALIVAAYAGFRLRELQSVLRTIQARPSTSDSQMVEVIKVVTQRPVPPQMTGTQWIRYQRLQAGLLIVIALIIASLTLAVVAIVKSPDKDSSATEISDIKFSFKSGGNQGGSNKLSTIVNILNRAKLGFNVIFDSSVSEEKKKRQVKFDTDLNDIPLKEFLDILCSRAGNLTYRIDQSTKIIILSSKGESQ
ncbi:MAG: hypothetical protein ACTFAL_13080 [Candidatus Electronema sp. V4]|uniref:hypothetical protein n=1 Tax=Candidatus Electronema sp. V4 TaxID=3454756 RepID=UPI00405539C9